MVTAELRKEKTAWNTIQQDVSVNRDELIRFQNELQTRVSESSRHGQVTAKLEQDLRQIIEAVRTENEMF